MTSISQLTQLKISNNFDSKDWNSLLVDGFFQEMSKMGFKEISEKDLTDNKFYENAFNSFVFNLLGSSNSLDNHIKSNFNF